jgi:glucose-6-phosphate isomerase
MTRAQSTCFHKPLTLTDPLLQIDTANMFAGKGSEAPLTPADLSALGPRLTRAHETLVERTRGGLEGQFACLTLHDQMPPQVPEIERVAADLRRFDDVIVIGIGGSSLGAKAVNRALNGTRAADAKPNLCFLENVDPYLLEHVLDRVEPAKTAVVAISKSGGTIETVVQYLVLRDWLERSLGREQARRHQWVVTDPASGWLRELARAENLPSLPVPPKVGGRYSVLSAVGLLPLAAVGIDVNELLAGAAANAARCAATDAAHNPALELAALYYLQDVKRNVRVSIMMPYVHPLRLFVDWYCQLWAESLGKFSTHPGELPGGTLPVRATGAVDQHSQLQMYLESRHDKMFTFLALSNWDHDATVPLPDEAAKRFPFLNGRLLSEVLDAEFRATRSVITRTGHPNLTIRLPALNAHVLGQLIDLYQRTTVYAGLLYEINPLDQPAVEQGKKLAVENLTAAARG